jgi:hypothetical protein
MDKLHEVEGVRFAPWVLDRLARTLKDQGAVWQS